MAARLFLVALALSAAACASSGAVPRPRPFPGASLPPAPAAPASPEAPAATATPEVPVVPDPALVPPTAASRFAPDAVVRTALGFQGIPYRNGGTDPSGFDCSGLVQYVFAQHGLALPREVREQFVFGEDVTPDKAEEGDLIFFATTGSGPSHVGLVVGGDEFVHAPSSRGVVRVEHFSTRYWAGRVVAVKRLR